jgi:hypothetical protein
MGNRKCCLPGVGWLVSASCLSFGLKNGSLNHIIAVLTQICKCWDSVSENRIIRRAKIGSLHFLSVLLEWPHTFLSEHVAPVFAHVIVVFSLTESQHLHSHCCENHVSAEERAKFTAWQEEQDRRSFFQASMLCFSKGAARLLTDQMASATSLMRARGAADR